MSNFKQWCKEQGFWHGSNISHVLMDKGVLSVPFDRLNDFYEKCVESYNSGEKIYVVEQKTENYNFFVDLDYKDEEALSPESVKSYCQVICDKVKKFGGKDALISYALPKPGGKDLIKTGIHINWSGFVVNRSSALALREHIINTLNTVYGSKNWSDIVDIAVYGSSSRKTQGSGFRMPWSHKIGKHEKCSGKGCTECNNTGKETQGEYRPVFMYKAGNDFTMLEEIKNKAVANVDMLHMATLRTESDDPVYVEGAELKIQNGSFSPEQIKNEFKDQEVLGLIEDFVRKNLEGQNTARITKIYESNKHFLVSTTSKYCENKRCDHNSNHVWFHIINDTISQKCFSTTDIVRHFGFCKDFRGRKHKLPPRITDKLYKDIEFSKYTERKPEKIEPEQEKTEEIDVKERLEKFIKKYLVKNNDFYITKLEKKKKAKTYTVHVSSYPCEVCNKNVHFQISKNKIEKKCNCMNRTHILSDKITTKL